MALTLLTPRQADLIVSSFKNVFKTGDISRLNSSAYNFIYLASGFIAHYNLYGFRDHYSDVNDLRRAILANVRINQWDNFRLGEQNYEYMMQKKEIYNRIVAMAKACWA